MLDGLKLNIMYKRTVHKFNEIVYLKEAVIKLAQ